MGEGGGEGGSSMQMYQFILEIESGADRRGEHGLQIIDQRRQDVEVDEFI